MSGVLCVVHNSIGLARFDLYNSPKCRASLKKKKKSLSFSRSKEYFYMETVGGFQEKFM